jgi:uncharacterized protein (DUF1778 family)
VVLRATPAERAMLAAWAEREGRPLAELVMCAALEEALDRLRSPAVLDAESQTGHHARAGGER